MTEDFRDLARVTGVLVFTLAVALVLSAGSFAQSGNLHNLLQQNLIVALVALGQFFVILTGGIDLSVAAVVSLSSVVAVLLRHYGIEVSIAGALISGTAVGLVNGVLVTFFRLPAFLVTLGTMQIVLSLAKILSGGGTLQPDLGSPIPLSLLGLYVNHAFFVSNALLVVIVAVVAASLYFRTAPGYFLYAIGSNDRAASLAGIRVNILRISAYAIGSMLAALSGLLFIARVGYGDPQAGSFVLLLDSIAAVTVGGASLYGGTGTILATVIGVLIIGVFNNLLNMLGIPATLQPTVKGMVILAAVYLYSQPFDPRRLLTAWKAKFGRSEIRK